MSREVQEVAGLPVAPPQPEAALALRVARAGVASPDRDAEAELCRRLAPRIRRYGLRHLRDADGAADLAQQVLVLTIERLRAGGLREPERVVSFVFGACRMLVLEQRRGQQRRESLLERHGDVLGIADIAVEPRLDHERVARCLQQLGERERSVIVQTFYEDRAADEVGAALGLSAGNVRVIRHRSLARLRRCMGLAAEGDA